MFHRIIAVVILSSSLACGPDAGRRVFTGPLTSTDALVAAVVEDDNFALYSCGGDTTFATHTIWFAGTLDADGEIQSSKSGFHVNAQISDTAVTGTLDVMGKSLNFSADISSEENYGELLKGPSDAPWPTAAILTQKGLNAEPKLQGVGCDDNGIVGQVTPAGPFFKGDNEINVQVMTGTSAQSVLLRPISF